MKVGGKAVAPGKKTLRVTGINETGRRSRRTMAGRKKRN